VGPTSNKERRKRYVDIYVAALPKDLRISESGRKVETEFELIRYDGHSTELAATPQSYAIQLPGALEKVQRVQC